MSGPAVAAPADWRIVVTPDESADGPLQWGDLTSVRIGAVWGSYLDETPTGGADALDLAGALQRFYDSLARQYGDTDGAVAAAVRWARVFHGVVVERWRPRGYSQSAWGDALVYLDDEADRALPADQQATQLEGAVSTADAWYRGDVYVVGLERRMVWHAYELADIPAGMSHTRETWEPVESIGGCYLDQDYTPAAVVREHFVLPEGVDPAALEVRGEW